MNTLRKNIKKILSAFLIATILFSAIGVAPLQARAQAVTVPIGTDFDFNNIMAHLKDFTLDRLAVMVANQLIERMTASVVNWINTGFDGSPSFLTNPEGFFLDVADQITGQFLHEMGLSAICSPFGLDIQLALALNQLNLRSTRYQCTLGTAIQNAQASAARGVNVNVTTNNPNGATLGDFMNPSNLARDREALSINDRSVGQFMAGDFGQGGWPAFLAMSMYQQNNANGLYLQAQSDIQQRISEKQLAVNNDLNRGNGFLSWEKCENISIDGYNGAVNQQTYGINDSQMAQLNQNGNQIVNLGNGSQVRKKTDPKTNTTTYQNCSTQTPGTLIGGTLQRQMNIPADKLVLVKTINDSIDAILGALVNRMLTQGLASLSKAQSGDNGRSYLRQIVDNANSSNSQNARVTRDRLVNETNSIINLSQDTIAAYDQAIQLLTDSKSRFDGAYACFDNKLKTITPLDPVQIAFAQAQMGSIAATVNTRINPILNTITGKRNSALAEIEELRTLAATTTAGTYIEEFSADDIRQQTDRLESYLGNVTRATRAATSDVATAKRELTVVEKQVTDLNKEALRYQTSCTSFPSVTTTTP